MRPMQKIIRLVLITYCVVYFQAFAQSNPLAIGVLPASVGGISMQPGAPNTGYPAGTAPVVPQLAPSYTGSGAQSNSGEMLNVKPELSTSPDTSVANGEAFGSNLFTGAFRQQGSVQFNPDYAITSGDSIQVRLWGAYNFDAVVSVDPKGNVFLPFVGPVQLVGVKNQDLQRVVESAVGSIFKSSVFSYASLAAAQPVRIYVSGFVRRPGMYGGTSMDSVLHYLDLAGGIDGDRGSFLNVQVKRGSQLRARISLYDFLLNGITPSVQLADGDVILVSPRGNTLKVSGLAENPKRFEFEAETQTLKNIAFMAKPLPQTTHARITRNTGAKKNIEYFPIAEAASVILKNGDEVEFTADKKPGTISVRVEGEHQSPQEYVLPYGARMGELLRKIEFSERSDMQSLQLFRQSVKDRQKQALAISLKSLETTALTARSGTSDEARLRAEESTLILKWVDRAKDIDPRGQIVIPDTADRNELLLENGDVIQVPARDGLVLVNGEVLFPNAISYDRKLVIDDYIKRAGGYTQNADSARIVIARRDGSFVDVNGEDGFFSAFTRKAAIKAGDEILVLPKLDVKSRQIWKDMTQIIYQIAVSARIVLGL
jgi:protein involved in polysaccharide export with SLBB domain